MTEDTEIVKIYNPDTSIDWHFGNHCQYACSYCPKHLHGNDSKKLELESLKNFVIEAEQNLTFSADKRIVFNFSGGEPTINSSFGPLVKWLKDRGHVIYVVSNGGRTLRWWQEWCENFDGVYLSFHTEQTDIYKFAQIADYISKLTRTEVHLIAWPDNFWKIKQAHEMLSKIENLAIVTKRIHKSWVSESVNIRDYTEEESLWINQNLRYGKSSFEGKKQFSIETQNGEILKNHPIFITNYKLNNFFGWKCNQGVNNLGISVYGEVFGAQCRQLLMGNIYETEKINWQKEASICEKTACTCMSDILITKSKK